MTTAPVTDGSLTSCWPSEAISWGKLQKNAMTVSVPGDYTMLMSVIAHALLKERAMCADLLHEKYKGNWERLFKRYPQAAGFLREPRRLYQKREQAMELLDRAAKRHLPEMRETLHFLQ